MYPIIVFNFMFDQTMINRKLMSQYLSLRKFVSKS